ncbi:MAG: hypothetical protein F6J86_18745 [Symploca sp. SIO1B1]|nr:hypothetical protein [Symploca sp. SIO1B1]
MEDFQAAFLERHTDTEILCQSGRKIAAMHFGGVTIECLLKAILIATLPKNATKEFKTDSNNPGHTITNPGHSFIGALKRHNRLYQRAQSFKEVREWINEIENPSQDFIALRYCCKEPDDTSYKRWLYAYNSLRRWLEKQATQL